MFVYAFVLGAFDRFNYGDILFAHISAYLLKEKFPDIQIHFIGFKKTDLGRSGGVLVRDFSFIDQFKSAPGESLVWVSGGAVLDVRWWTMTQMLLSDRGSKAFRRVRRYLRDEMLDFLCRRYHRSPHPMPWIFDRDALPFDEGFAIAYNSVGGANFSPLPERLRSAVRTGLSTADYVSVRDANSRDALAEIGVAPVELVPDSAVLLNESSLSKTLFGLGEEEANADPYGTRLSLPEGSICFQCAGRFFRRFEDDICDQIEKLHEVTEQNIVVFGIGYAPFHDDHLTIDGISDRLGENEWLHVYREESVSGIARLIQKSSCYIGTSLHGYITAFAFSRPRVGLSPDVGKLVGFRDAWDLPSMPVGISFSDFSEAACRALRHDPETLNGVARRTKDLYVSKFEAIWDGALADKAAGSSRS
ncbi:polysaccharide pyruvyl transferase family protein [Algihabitans albus]|uniref:polysaccharide pyruvyl transferase family protein n=1 Tax=Algihabitans albus TaxID=2164067 RepID=UPI000E5D6F0B|nr:polysaccharide pyruvyl transferase family protein [Algihabitans albus]